MFLGILRLFFLNINVLDCLVGIDMVWFKIWGYVVILK